jgi:hypothetical protein
MKILLFIEIILYMNFFFSQEWFVLKDRQDENKVLELISKTIGTTPQI